MSRARTSYAASAEGFAVPGAGYSSEEPTAGYYRFRLVRGGHPVGVTIWHGPPLDPETGEEMDRAPRWQATWNGQPIDLERVWPVCGREPITEAEARHLKAIYEWGLMFAPDSPQANPEKPIDLLDPDTPLPF